ncbi:MAG: flagellar protein FliT [Pseudomonadota bacterium]
MSSEDTLRTLTELSEVMLSKARAGDWDALPELEQQRSALIQQCFPLQDIGDIEAARLALQGLLQANDELVRLAGEARSALASELGQLRSASSAIKSYQAHEG